MKTGQKKRQEQKKGLWRREREYGKNVSGLSLCALTKQSFKHDNFHYFWCLIYIFSYTQLIGGVWIMAAFVCKK